ncbi:hypothetical protein H2204_003750 [Knufia peltigerae]|uniref:Uncharacterized protein n=1 Tax=Knufia peltigerae TaxID=1002370 RepID=A0AA39D1P5_9EURO|nr:hypothetical protein H2204_003750 [Knufia peltigerae]
MPPGWFLGDWFITFSNQELYRLFRNFIWTLTRPCLDGACYAQEATKLDTLTSFQLVNDTKKPNATYFAYSHDTSIAVDAYHSVPAGSLASQNNTYEIIGWGYDSNDAAFIVVFETPTASQTVPSLDIFSRDPSGPSDDTLNAIKVGIKTFGNQHLVDLLRNVTKTPQDGGRAGDTWPSCNATCRTNAVIIGAEMRTDTIVLQSIQSLLTEVVRENWICPVDNQQVKEKWAKEK